MSLNKRNYEYRTTSITSQNLNEIQDAIISNETAISNTYTKSEVDGAISSAISGVTSFDYEVVDSLPVSGVKGTIYLVHDDGTAPNYYDEYIYVNNAWEKIGDTQIDISGKEDKTYLSIGSTQYELVISSTDAGQSGKIVFYVE